jgi:hypothetical protein
MNLSVRVPWEKPAHCFADGAAGHSVFTVSIGQNGPHEGLEREFGEALLANVISRNVSAAMASGEDRSEGA